METGRILTGYLLAKAGAALFSTKAIFIKLAYAERADPLLMLAWRMIFSLPFFLSVGAWVLHAARRDGKEWPAPATVIRALMAGLIGYGLAVLLLGERFALIGGIGTALVVGGVGYHSWRDLRN